MRRPCKPRNHNRRDVPFGHRLLFVAKRKEKMEFTVRKLTPKVGAEINGIDLRRPLDPDTVARVRKV